VSVPISYATKYTSLIATARMHMAASKGSPDTPSTYVIDPYWSDDELFNIAKRGTTDLWGAIIDLHEEHYLKFAPTDGTVVLSSGNTQISGVPNDLFRVYLIEPIDPTTNQCAFVPRAYNHIEFINARGQTVTVSFSPTSGVNIFYDVTGVGAPNSAPVILTAPKLSSDVQLSLVYVPTLGINNFRLTDATNPIPGESDNAIIAWIVAYARAKERDDRMPDPGWLAVYATEKNALLTRMKPRQEQEAQYADGTFDGYWR
jgi:hypothetical protein